MQKGGWNIFIKYSRIKYKIQQDFYDAAIFGGTKKVRICVGIWLAR